MIRYWRHLLIGQRTLSSIGGVAVLFAVSFFIPQLFPFAQAALIVLTALFLADLFMLFRQDEPLTAERQLPKVLSLGDANEVQLSIQSHSPLAWHIRIHDELPFQLQERLFEEEVDIPAFGQQKLIYHIRPLQRGDYGFGRIKMVLQGPMGMLSRVVPGGAEEDARVYPSIIQMREFELRAFSRIANQEGIKRLRRAGVSYEFEQISPYVQGDDLRHINWKAAARRQELMVNRFESERAQPVYCVICKNREMLMPFDGLSLMDYAINTSLAVSNVALLKYDKIGLITFSDRIGSSLRASRERQQLKRIMNALYNEKEREKEADYALLEKSLRSLAPTRSLLFLFIHFESSYALDRALPHLKAIAARHLLVVIFFRNVEVERFSKSRAQDIKGIYTRALAQRMTNEKEAMFHRLREMGIQAILTEPERLSMHTVDKYLELKARGLF